MRSRHHAQKHAAVGAAVARIAVREMLADVAVAHGAEQRVAQRVNHHVAVRVRDDALRMGDAHAAEHDMIARAEGVHVHALSDSHVAALSPS